MAYRSLYVFRPPVISFFFWHNIEVHAITALSHERLFAAVPNWWSRLVPSRYLLFPSALVFVYCSNYARSKGNDREEKMSIAVSEFIFMTNVSFFETPLARVHWKAMNDWEIIGRGGVLFTLPFSYYDQVTRCSFLPILKWINCDPSLTLMDLDHLIGIDCRVIVSSDPGLPYDWNDGYAFHLTEPLTYNRGRRGPVGTYLDGEARAEL